MVPRNQNVETLLSSRFLHTSTHFHSRKPIQSGIISRSSSPPPSKGAEPRRLTAATWQRTWAELGAELRACRPRVGSSGRSRRGQTPPPRLPSPLQAHTRTRVKFYNFSAILNFSKSFSKCWLLFSHGSVSFVDTKVS